MININEVIDNCLREKNITEDQFITKYSDLITKNIALTYMPTDCYKEILRASIAYCLTNNIDISKGYIYRYNQDYQNAIVYIVYGDITVNMLTVDYSTEHLIIRGDGTLTVEGEDQQPCIGLATHTGMSYGRWSNPDYPKDWKSIEIRGNLKVILNSKVSNFSIGVYNCKEIPNLYIGKNCELVCPETTQGSGKRVLTQKAVAPIGSSKISGEPVYKWLPEGKSDDFLIDPEVLKLVEGKPFARYVTSATTFKRAKHACALYEEFGNNINYEVLFYFKDSSVAIPAAILNPPDWKDAICTTREDRFELSTGKFNIMKECTDRHNKFDVYGWTGDLFTLIKYIIMNCKVTEWSVEYCYQLIPAYGFQFDSKLTHYENLLHYLETVVRYIKDNPNEIDYNESNLKDMEEFILKHHLQDDNTKELSEERDSLQEVLSKLSK